MSRKTDKTLTDLHRLLETQNFKSEAEVRNFLENVLGPSVPSLPKEALNAAEQAEDLVFAAYDLPPMQARQQIEKALHLHINCIAAYEFLGQLENSPQIAAVFFEKGIAIGRQMFGGQYLKEHKGFFWGFHETRPFMRCLQHYAHCLFAFDNVSECVAVYEEMIELNSNDNQGVRDQMMLYLIALNEKEKYLKYDAMFNEHSVAFPLFNRALFTFVTEGETAHANAQLQLALKNNKYVAAKLVSKKPITVQADSYSPGTASEADYYACFARTIWQTTNGAIGWLKKHSAKQ